MNKMDELDTLTINSFLSGVSLIGSIVVIASIIQDFRTESVFGNVLSGVGLGLLLMMFITTNNIKKKSLANLKKVVTSDNTLLATKEKNKGS